VQVVPVPSGIRGPDPDELARAFERTGVRAFYAQPNFANPTGAQWSSALADQVLDTMRQYGAFLIEDDWAHDFGITADPAPIAARDDSGHVVYLRSLTKSVSPAVRIAGIIARGPARERILADAQALSMYVSGILQTVGVIIAPGNECFPAEPTGPCLRLTYSGPNPGVFPDGARMIGRTLAGNN
jgi:DNA-binding transcriptional MocR family regulator